MNVIELFGYMTATLLAALVITRDLRAGCMAAIYGLVTFLVINRVAWPLNAWVTRRGTKWLNLYVAVLVGVVPAFTAGLIVTRGALWQALSIGLLLPVMWIIFIGSLWGPVWVLEMIFGRKKGRD